jgi:hypothetical protein
MYEWTPDRFNPLGWKYQEKGTINKYLNQINKINSIGGYGPTLSANQMRQSLLPITEQNSHRKLIDDLQLKLEKSNNKI